MKSFWNRPTWKLHNDGDQVVMDVPHEASSLVLVLVMLTKALEILARVAQ